MKIHCTEIKIHIAANINQTNEGVARAGWCATTCCPLVSAGRSPITESDHID